MYSANELLELERYKKNITRDKLVNGICSPQLLIKATDKGADIELLTLESLLERLGRSPERLEYIVSNTEYENIKLREQIEEYAFKQNYNITINLLNQLIPDIKSASQINKMYYHRINAYAIFQSRIDNYIELSKQECLTAIYTTLPGITINNYCEYLISAYEIENILIYARILIDSGETPHAARILRETIRYAKDNYTDILLQARIIPKCVYLLCSFCANIMPKDLCYTYCKEGLELLRSNGIIYMMKPLLEFFIQYSNALRKTADIDLLIQCNNELKNLETEFSSYFPGTSLIFHWQKTVYHLDAEIIRAERKQKNISQQELAANIFSNPASISYIENGKCALSKAKFGTIMNQLGLSKPRRSGFVLVNSFDTLEKIDLIRTAMTRQDYDLVLELLSNSDIANQLNINILEAYKIAAASCKKYDYDEKELSRLKTAINATYPLTSEHHLRIPFLEELDTIITYTWKLYISSPTEVSAIYQKLINACLSSGIAPKHYYRIWSSIFSSHVKYNKNTLSQETIIDICNETIKNSLLSGNGAAISTAYWSRFMALHENDYDKKMVLKRSYLFAELYNEKTASIKKQHFQELKE